MFQKIKNAMLPSKDRQPSSSLLTVGEELDRTWIVMMSQPSSHSDDDNSPNNSRDDAVDKKNQSRTCSELHRPSFRMKLTHVRNKNYNHPTCDTGTVAVIITEEMNFSCIEEEQGDCSFVGLPLVTAVWDE
jgi:hypothetical protein